NCLRKDAAASSLAAADAASMMRNDRDTCIAQPAPGAMPGIRERQHRAAVRESDYHGLNGDPCWQSQRSSRLVQSQEQQAHGSSPSSSRPLPLACASLMLSSSKNSSQ